EGGRELRLTLADLAMLRHAVSLEAAQQRVLVLPLRATAVAPDAVNDFRDLTDLVEHGSRIGFVELLLRQHLGRVDPWPRRRMRPAAADGPWLGAGLSADGDAGE